MRRILVIGSTEEHLTRARCLAQRHLCEVVAAVPWDEAVGRFDRTQPDGVILASDPLQPHEVAVVWSLRARNPFIMIVPPGIPSVQNGRVSFRLEAAEPAAIAAENAPRH